jgi:hypothetical protein
LYSLSTAISTLYGHFAQQVERREEGRRWRDRKGRRDKGRGERDGEKEVT